MGTARAAASLGLVLLVFAAAATAGDVTSGVDTKIWGRAVFNMHYDTAIQAQDFMSYITDDQTEEFNFNPRDTRFGFAASSRQGDWTYKSVFEIDFYGDHAGNNLLPRLRLGYAEAANGRGLSIRGGQDWVPVAQQHPGTIDFGIQSWSGNLWWRVPQVTLRYQQQKTEFLVSAMKHRVSIDQEVQERMPWLLGRVAFPGLLGAGSVLALGGGFRSVEVDSVDYSPYLVAVELKVPLGSRFNLTGEAYLGKGVGREFVHYGFDYNPDHPAGARAIESQGGFLSLMFAASPKVELNAGYGMDDPKDEDLTAADAPYLKNSSLFGNFKYKVTPQFGWGLEVIHLMTDVGEADDLTGQRFTGSWWYIF
ncbi:MAG: hypothetical protein ABR506_05245 [Candidatus Krumholzibacteriia bacterium]